MIDWSLAIQGVGFAVVLPVVFLCFWIGASFKVRRLKIQAKTSQAALDSLLRYRIGSYIALSKTSGSVGDHDVVRDRQQVQATTLRPVTERVDTISEPTLDDTDHRLTLPTLTEIRAMQVRFHPPPPIPPRRLVGHS